MAEKLEMMPPESRWGTTIPYCLWGDEGTLKNSASWMFGTVCPGVTKLFWDFGKLEPFKDRTRG